MRARAIQPPRQSPKRSMASSAYSEQLGRWRQRGPISGNSVKRYSITSPRPAARGKRANENGTLAAGVPCICHISKWNRGGLNLVEKIEHRDFFTLDPNLWRT